MKSCLVIGGAGFIGAHLCNKLFQEKKHVVVLDNLLRGKRENIEHLLSFDNFSFYEGDANDKQLLAEIIKKHKIDFIFHLAANSDIKASSQNPDIEFVNTQNTTWNILSCMKETNVKKIFFSSTSAVYGDKKGIPCNENDVLDPISYYGACKMASEAYIRAFSYMNGFNALIFRFPNVIGPNLTHGVIFDFINRLRDDSAYLDVLGDGNQSKPYIYVSELIDAIFFFSNQMKDETNVTTFNIGVYGQTKVSTIANLVVKHMGLKNTIIRYGDTKSGWKGDVPNFQYDNSKVEKAGWHSSITSDQAVEKTIIEVLKASK